MGRKRTQVLSVLVDGSNRTVEELVGCTSFRSFFRATRTGGEPIGSDQFREVRQALLDHFGGVTAFTRSPAQGLWQDGSRVERDEVLLYEVMVTELDRDWWAAYRKELEDKFHQQELVIRAHLIERL